jgi:hypothetical protein
MYHPFRTKEATPMTESGLMTAYINPNSVDQFRSIPGYAGAMIFGFEEQANVDLMGVLVDAWYGPGNWNPPS